MYYQVRTRIVTEAAAIVEADSKNEARAKASAGMYTHLDDDMLFEDEIALQEENVLGVFVDDCELYDDGGEDDETDGYDEDEYVDNFDGEDEYEPPEYFSD